MISTDLQSSKVKGHLYCFSTADLSGKIDAFLVRAHRYGLAANILQYLNFLTVLRRIFQQNSIA